MLETTHFEGEPPNRQLVYELRRRAFEGIDLPDLLALVAERLQIPKDEVGCFAIVAYLRMAFDVRIAEGKHFASRLERTRGGYINTEPATGEVVVAQIVANRNAWSQNLYPASP